MAIEIRDASPADAAGLVPLIAALGHEATAAELEARLVRYQGLATDRILVAQDGDLLVGLVATHRAPTLHRRGDSGRVAALAVLPSHQGTGIGRRLLAAAEALLRDAGCAHLELTSGSHRTGAHRFYQRQGWVGDGIRFRKPITGPGSPAGA